MAKKRRGKIEHYRKKQPSLSWDELQRMLDACQTAEEKALLMLGANTGIRRRDIVEIELMNVDLDNARLSFWEHKKDRPWSVALEPDVVQALRIYIDTLPDDQRFLFDFSGRTAYNRLQTIKERAGISKDLDFHSLRRTFVRLSKDMGRSPRFVMDQTGDTARTILENYEAYTLDELVDHMKDDGIFQRLREQHGEGRDGGD